MNNLFKGTNLIFSVSIISTFIFAFVVVFSDYSGDVQLKISSSGIELKIIGKDKESF